MAHKRSHQSRRPRSLSCNARGRLFRAHRNRDAGDALPRRGAWSGADLWRECFERTWWLAERAEKIAATSAAARREAEERLRTLAHRLAEVQEAERSSLARELHDEIGQALTGLKLLLAAAGAAPPEVPASAQRLQDATEIIDDLIRRVRALSLDLRPPMLDESGLLPALTWQVQRFTQQAGIRVALRHRGIERRFPAGVEIAVYRIAQEALTNVARHAGGAAEAVVRVWSGDAALYLQVQDAGAGFDVCAEERRRSGAGLLGMKERAHLLGGSFSVESAPGRGTTVRAELPLAPVPPLAWEAEA